MLTMMRKKMSNQKGFTLVELMVVVVILGILVAIAVPIYGSVGKNAADKAHDANVRILKGAGATYLTEHSITEDLVVVDELDEYLETKLADMKVPEKSEAYNADSPGYSVTITKATGTITVEPTYIKDL